MTGGKELAESPGETPKAELAGNAITWEGRTSSSAE